MTTNHLYPGKPNYRGPKSGYFTLLHHAGELVECSDNVMERVEYIKTVKAKHEIPVRLRHIVFIPKKMWPKGMQEAYDKWLEAGFKWLGADSRLLEAYAKRREAENRWLKAEARWLKADADKLLAYLHKHVKNCKWNGREIVFK